MRLELDREDLLPEHKSVACGATKWFHFSDQAQFAIGLIGFGVFYDQKGGPNENYNRVYSPDQKEAA